MRFYNQRVISEFQNRVDHTGYMSNTNYSTDDERVSTVLIAFL